MREGWYNEDYLILFEHHEIEQKEKAYGLDSLLPGYRLVGLVGWDDFLVMERESQRLFRVPTVPISAQKKREWRDSVDSGVLKSDPRFQGKIKWYVKPIIFGGDPGSGANMIWISHETHIQAVKFWNEAYTRIAENK